MISLQSTDACLRSRSTTNKDTLGCGAVGRELCVRVLKSGNDDGGVRIEPDPSAYYHAPRSEASQRSLSSAGLLALETTQFLVLDRGPGSLRQRQYASMHDARM
jgi:hypothetical protein